MLQIVKLERKNAKKTWKEQQIKALKINSNLFNFKCEKDFVSLEITAAPYKLRKKEEFVWEKKEEA